MESYADRNSSADSGDIPPAADSTLMTVSSRSPASDTLSMIHIHDRFPLFAFCKIPLVIFDCTPKQRKPSIYPVARPERIRWKSNTSRPPDGIRSNRTRQKDGCNPSFICFPVEKLPTAGRRLSPCLSLAPHALTACIVFQGSFLSSYGNLLFQFWVKSTHKTIAGHRSRMASSAMAVMAQSL